MSNTEWLVSLSLGTLVISGLIALGFLAKYGFNRLIKEQENNSKKIEEILQAIVRCVTWDDLDKVISPIKKDIRCQEYRITVVETRCEGRYDGKKDAKQ